MTTTILRKNLMALSGLFLCLFLVVHLLGNLQLLLPPEEAMVKFNGYSKFMTGNPLIKVVSYLLYASIIVHTIYAGIITLYNQKSSGGQYMFDRRGGTSTWYSRNMGILGMILLIFLVIHLKDFWYEYKWGSIPLDPSGHKDLYSIVIAAYGQWWYVLLNVIAFIALGYHLLHGFFSAFKTLGAYPTGLSRMLYFVSVCLTLLLTIGFVFIPIFVYVKYYL